MTTQMLFLAERKVADKELTLFNSSLRNEAGFLSVNERAYLAAMHLKQPEIDKMQLAFEFDDQ